MHYSFLTEKREKHVHQTRSNNNKTIRDIQWMGKYDIQSLFLGNCLNGKELKKKNQTGPEHLWKSVQIFTDTLL